MANGFVIQTDHVLSELIELHRSTFQDKHLNILKVGAVGEPVINGNKASVSVEAPGKLAYFTMWSHGSVQAVIVDEKTMQEVYSVDYCTDSAEDAKSEFRNWLSAL